jgi:hypothetical protein
MSLYILNICYTVNLKYYTIRLYSLKPLLFDIHVTCRDARYPVIKPHTPHRHNRVVLFNHSGVYSTYNSWSPSCWNPSSVSQLEADLEAASVQQFVENYLTMCRQRIGYHTVDHALRHTYIIVIQVCKTLGLSSSQAVSRTAEDLSQTHSIRMFCGQSATRTGFFWVRAISPVGIFAPVLGFRPSFVTNPKSS